MHSSEAYEPIHPPDAITTNLPVEKQYALELLRFTYPDQHRL